MKLHLALACAAVLLLSACVSTPQATRSRSLGDDDAGLFDPVARAEAHTEMVSDAQSLEHNERAVKFVQRDLPFPVVIDPYGAIADDPVVSEAILHNSELTNLKKHFLEPLAASPYAREITKVRIDAASREWYQWKCVIELQWLSPISITHFSGLYDGRDDHDPDGYKKSRRYVLGELLRIGKRGRLEPVIFK